MKMCQLCLNCDRSHCACTLHEVYHVVFTLISCLLFSREKLFDMINDFPTIHNLMTDDPETQQKEQPTVTDKRKNKSKPNPSKVKDYIPKHALLAYQLCDILLRVISADFTSCCMDSLS